MPCEGKTGPVYVLVAGMYILRFISANSRVQVHLRARDAEQAEVWITYMVFDAVLLLLFLLLRRAVVRDGEDVALHVDFDVLLVHAR